MIVSTPRSVSVQIARRAIARFNVLQTPAMGVVDNMSSLDCSHCSGKIELNERGGARELAYTLSLAFLGEVPIDPGVRIGGDLGEPILIAQPELRAACALRKVARAVANRVREANFERERKRSVAAASPEAGVRVSDGRTGGQVKEIGRSRGSGSGGIRKTA